MDFNTYDSSLQVVTSPDGEIVTLKDDKFTWRERKVKTLKLAKLYQKAGYPELAEKVAVCSTWLKYGVSADGKKDLCAANFCQLRLCPLCIARRAKRAAYKVSKVLDMAEQEHPGVKFLFLTLTIQNVPGDQLRDALCQLTKGWDRLLKHRRVKKAVKGWFRAVEITRGDNKYHTRKDGTRFFYADKGYHPHIHAILTVPAEYFSRDAGLYIEQSEWVERWQTSFRAEYAPSVRIQTAKSKGEFEAGRAAAVEASKYAVKDSDYIDDTQPESRLVEIVKDYTQALHRRRLTAFGGWLKDAAKALDAEDLDNGDLVHLDDETVREDVAELIEVYNWHFGAGDYVLTSRQVNPLKLIREK